MEHPLAEPLLKIGFDEPGVRRLLRNYSVPRLRQWIDITLAALECHGPGFFKSCPQAYMTDSLKNKRTPPDWFIEIRKQEHATGRPTAGRARTSAGAEPESAREILHRVFLCARAAPAVRATKSNVVSGT